MIYIIINYFVADACKDENQKDYLNVSRGEETSSEVEITVASNKPMTMN